jgi:hypothetical protein
VLACVDGEVDVVKDDVVAAGHVDVGQMQERWHSFLGYRTALAARIVAGLVCPVAVATLMQKLLFGIHT